MKLAEALQERADLNRRIQQLQQRLNNNAIVQEGEQPAEDPAALLNELDRCAAQLVQLTALLARRDALTLKLNSYRGLTQAASQLVRRGTRSEIKLLSTVNVKELQIQVDAMAKNLRLLDNSIQAANWATELA